MGRGDRKVGYLGNAGNFVEGYLTKYVGFDGNYEEEFDPYGIEYFYVGESRCLFDEKNYESYRLGWIENEEWVWLFVIFFIDDDEEIVVIIYLLIGIFIWIYFDNEENEIIELNRNKIFELFFLWYFIILVVINIVKKNKYDAFVNSKLLIDRYTWEKWC